MFALTAYASIPALVQQILRFISYWLLGSTPLTTTNVVELLVDFFNVFTIIGLVLVGVAVMVNYGLTVRKAAGGAHPDDSIARPRSLLAADGERRSRQTRAASSACAPVNGVSFL
jgi:hypothetical protein